MLKSTACVCIQTATLSTPPRETESPGQLYNDEKLSSAPCRIVSSPRYRWCKKYPSPITVKTDHTSVPCTRHTRLKRENSVFKFTVRSILKSSKMEDGLVISYTSRLALYTKLGHFVIYFCYLLFTSIRWPWVDLQLTLTSSMMPKSFARIL